MSINEALQSIGNTPVERVFDFATTVMIWGVIVPSAVGVVFMIIMWLKVRKELKP